MFYTRNTYRISQNCLAVFRLCLRIFVPVPGHRTASSVWVLECWHRCVATLSSCNFAFSVLHGTFLAPHWCSPFHQMVPCCSGLSSPPPDSCTQTYTHTHKKSNLKPHTFLRLVQACQDSLYFWGCYVHSSLIQVSVRFRLQKIRPFLSTFDFSIVKEQGRSRQNDQAVRTSLASAMSLGRSNSWGLVRFCWDMEGLHCQTGFPFWLWSQTHIYTHVPSSPVSLKLLVTYLFSYSCHPSLLIISSAH